MDAAPGVVALNPLSWADELDERTLAGAHLQVQFVRTRVRAIRPPFASRSTANPGLEHDPCGGARVRDRRLAGPLGDSGIVDKLDHLFRVVLKEIALRKLSNDILLLIWDCF